MANGDVICQHCYEDGYNDACKVCDNKYHKDDREEFCTWKGLVVQSCG